MIRVHGTSVALDGDGILLRGPSGSGKSDLALRLIDEGAVSTFTFAPADDVLLGAAFLANGFRRSAVLARHLVVNGARKDAVLWSKKLVGAPGE